MTFKIDFHLASGANTDLHRISVIGNEHVFTRLLRRPTNVESSFLLGSANQLGFWLIDNWWRLRYESLPLSGPTPEWRLAHDLSSVGGGTAWPRLTIWNEDDRTGLAGRKDPVGIIGPVQYFTEALTFILTKEWEEEVDQFLDMIKIGEGPLGSDKSAFLSQLQALTFERNTPEIALWRRLEARAGFDPDTAPEGLIQQLDEYLREFSEFDVEEAVQASPGEVAANDLSNGLLAARRSRLTCNFAAALDACSVKVEDEPSTNPPWVLAELCAKRIRASIGLTGGPLHSSKLADLVKTSPHSFRSFDKSFETLPYGIRVADEGAAGPQHLALRARHESDRRFEIARALGDAVYSKTSTMGPIGRSKTARQKFQRSFAQSLLCPFEDLRDFFDGHSINDDEIMGAAQHFHVNTKVIQTTLVKKNVLSADQFEDLLEAA